MNIHKLKIIPVIFFLGFFLESCVAPLIVTKKNIILYSVEINNKSGYINQKGKVKIEPIYDICSGVDYYGCSSESIFYWIKGEESFIVRKNGKYGLINYKGEEVTGFIYNELRYSVDYFDVSINEKYGIIDYDGKELLPLIFSSPYFISTDSVFTASINYKNGLYYRDSNKFREFDFHVTSPLHDGFAVVETRNDKFGMINSNGDLVIDTIYSDMGSFVGENDLLAVRNDSVWNYINPQGEMKIEGNFDKAEFFWSHYAIVVKDGKYGIIDTLGNFLIEPKYEFLRSTGGPLIKFGDSKYPSYGKVGLINLNGDTVLNNDYDHTRGIAGYSEVLIDSKYGVISLDTKEVIIPFNFDYVDYDDIDLTLLRFHDSEGNYFMGYINRKKRIVWSNNSKLLKQLLK